MKPQRCYHEDPVLEAEAAAAERRKQVAMAELVHALGGTLDERVGQDGEAFEAALKRLIDADKAALKARGR